MLKYTLRKLIQIPITVLAIIIIIFMLVNLAPGDPVYAMLGEWPAPPEYVEMMRHRLGLDQPLLVRLWLYIVNVAQGDLGFSWYYNRSVVDLMLERAPVTLLLVLSALLVATVVGVVAGVLAAAHERSALGNSANVAMLVAYSIPVFWLAQMTVVVFAIWLNWFPTQGTHDLRASQDGAGAVLSRIHHLVLPVAVLAIRSLALDFRVARSGVIEVLSQDYVRTAKAKGLAGRAILFRHALRNALLPVITIKGLDIGFAISGATLVEVVFGWPGMGRLTLDAIANRDFPVLMGVFVTITVVVLITNFLTDYVYALADPRIRVR